VISGRPSLYDRHLETVTVWRVLQGGVCVCACNGLAGAGRGVT
jgi:hypothetical protein